ncbi:Hypp4330 [Branchiostoma lanceolatum]|uniref:Hypp4330 protein n=1 Tax=Branchiostoma lanceolatum TaxID=7740 RepID=A0A8K0A6X2_BRALA|nr:Hypp4330 [Branchiostoma lanceolatum]
MYFDMIPARLPCHYPLGMGGKDLFSIPTEDLPCPSPVVKITQDVEDDLQFRCQATWEEESSIFWILPDNTTILLPGLGEVERKINLTSQHLNISYEHSISACGWTWVTSSSVTTSCSNGQTAPNYAIRTVSVLVVDEELVREWKGMSISCGVKSFSGNVVAEMPLGATLLSHKSESQVKSASPGPTSSPLTFSHDTITTSTYYSSEVLADNASEALFDIIGTNKGTLTSDESSTPAPLVVTNSTSPVYTDDFVILLPSENNKRLSLSYYIVSALCTVPFAFISAACIYLQSRRYAYTEEERITEQKSCHQANSDTLSENESDNSIKTTMNDPYYSTINDNSVNTTMNDPCYSTIKDQPENEQVNPYGVAKTCSRYDCAEKRSCDVRENSIETPGPRSQQCNCYDQMSGEYTALKP